MIPIPGGTYNAGGFEQGPSGAGAPAQPNGWIQYLQRLRQQKMQNGQTALQQPQQQHMAPSTQAYNQIGQMAGMGLSALLRPKVKNVGQDAQDQGIAAGTSTPMPMLGPDPSVGGGDNFSDFMPEFANGAQDVQGPIPGVVAEAGPELISNDNGNQEVVRRPQVRMLGVGGTDTITPLTGPPHIPTPAGRKLLKRLHPRHRFADGGEVYDDSEDAQPLAPDPSGSTPWNAAYNPPPLQSPEMGPIFSGQDAANAGAVNAPPGTPPLSIRDQLAALKMPIPKKPSILQRLAAGAIGGAAGYVNASGKRMNPINAGPAENALLYPGYGQQMQQYAAQRQDLQNQLAQQTGAVSDQTQQAQLQHLQAQTALTQQQVKNAPLLQTLEHSELIPDPDPQRANPTQYPGTHLGAIGPQGTPMYRPTAGELEAQKKTADAKAKQDLYEELPPVVATALGVDPKKRYPSDVAERYYAAYAKAQESKNPTIASLAMQAAQGDENAKRALALVAQTSLQSKVTVNAGSDKLAASRAIRDAYNQSGGDWNKVLEGARAMKFGDYSSDIADHAQKMTQLAPAQQTRVAAADTGIEQVATAQNAIKEFVKNHPDLVGSGWSHPITGIKRWAETKTGTEPGDIGNVDMALSSVAALQPQQHGFRSSQALEGFKRDAGIDLRTHQYDPNRAWLINPDKAISGLQSIADFNAKLRDNIVKVAGKGGPAQTNQGSPAPSGGQFQQVKTDTNGEQWGWSPGMKQWQKITTPQQ